MLVSIRTQTRSDDVSPPTLRMCPDLLFIDCFLGVYNNYTKIRKVTNNMIIRYSKYGVVSAGTLNALHGRFELRLVKLRIQTALRQ